MRLRNFKLGNDNTSIVLKNGIELRLQSDYEFSGYHFDYKNRSIEFFWTKMDGEWVNPQAPPNIKLSFVEVDFIKFRFKDPHAVIFDDYTLAYIGFLPTNMRDEMNSIISNEFIREDQDILLGFCNNQVVKFSCKNAFFLTLSGKMLEKMPKMYFVSEG